jgi:hypothetical protein
MLNIRNEAQKPGNLPGSEGYPTPNEANVPILADYRKKWS